jgi:DNA-directed RNA polymerase subunit RPC12/RpoP
MSELTFKCETCGQRLIAETGMAGEIMNCPGCGKSICVPCENPDQMQNTELLLRKLLDAQLQTARTLVEIRNFIAALLIVELIWWLLNSGVLRLL